MKSGFELGQPIGRVIFASSTSASAFSFLVRKKRISRKA